MIVRSYDVHGTKLSITAGDEELLRSFAIYLSEFACAPVQDVHFAVDIRRGSSRRPDAGAALIFEGELAPGVPCTLSVVGTRSWLHAPGVLSVLSDQSSGKARVDVETTLASAAGAMAVLRVIDLALQVGRQALLHGAALTLPDAGGKAILLFAPSGRGKTTTALALALAGFGLITDDAIVLQGNHGSDLPCPMVWGLPRPLKVHRNTAVLLPALAPCLTNEWDEFGEQAVHAATLRKAAAIAPVAVRPVPACALVSVGARTSGAHRLEPIAKAEMLVELSSDNIRRRAVGMLDGDVWRFGRLANLVSALPCLRLNVGTPLASLAGVFDRESRNWT